MKNRILDPDSISSIVQFSILFNKIRQTFKYLDGKELVLNETSFQICVYVSIVSSAFWKQKNVKDLYISPQEYIYEVWIHSKLFSARIQKVKE